MRKSISEIIERNKECINFFITKNISICALPILETCVIFIRLMHKLSTDENKEENKFEL
jgi:hypothetical protein